MVGLAEACSHIAAVLFYVENITKSVNENSVTDVPAYWIAPPSVSKVPMVPIHEVDFSKIRNHLQQSKIFLGIFNKLTAVCKDLVFSFYSVYTFIYVYTLIVNFL